jgi:Spy/CpxP family protein refolding chaperone
VYRDGRTEGRLRAWLGLSLCAALLFTCAARASASVAQDGADAQEESAADDGRTTRRGEAARGRLDWQRELNLTPEQLAQIREIRRQADRDIRATARRLNEARRALDEAIYAESSDERLIERRAQELASAQAEMTRLRAMTELKVRRVLTDEQLKTFRELRRAAQTRQGLRRQRRDARQERRRQRRNTRDALDNSTPPEE